MLNESTLYPVRQGSLNPTRLRQGLQFRRLNEDWDGHEAGSLWLVYAYGDGTCNAWRVSFHLIRFLLIALTLFTLPLQLKVICTLFLKVYLNMKGIPQCLS